MNRPQAAEEGPATRAARGFPPIEICLVIVFVGIDLFVALQSIPEVVHSDQALPRLVGALGADLAMIVGLAMRRRWAFWLSAVLLFLRCVVLLGQVHRFGEEGGKTGIDIGMALGYLAAGILLIVCRVRGAYEKE